MALNHSISSLLRASYFLSTEPTPNKHSSKQALGLKQKKLPRRVAE